MLSVYFGNYSRKLMFLFATYFYFFYFIPLVFILPLAYENAFGDYDLTMKIIGFILIGLGVLIIIALFTYYILRKFSKYFKRTGDLITSKFAPLTLIAFFKQNFENAGIITNSLGYSISISLFIYGFFNKQAETKYIVKSAFYAFPFIITLLFLTHHLILRLRVCNPKVLLY